MTKSTGVTEEECNQALDTASMSYVNLVVTEDGEVPILPGLSLWWIVALESGKHLPLLTGARCNIHYCSAGVIGYPF